MAFLADASAELAGSLDYERTLRRVARLAVPRLADCCVVDVVELGRSVLHQLAVVHVDEECRAARPRAGSRLPEQFPDDESSVVGAVLRDGKPLLVERVDDEYLAAMARDAGHLEALGRLALTSIMTGVPWRPGGGCSARSRSSPRTPDAATRTTTCRSPRSRAKRRALRGQRASLPPAEPRCTPLQRSLLPPELPEIPGDRGRRPLSARPGRAWRSEVISTTSSRPSGGQLGRRSRGRLRQGRRTRLPSRALPATRSGHGCDAGRRHRSGVLRTLNDACCRASTPRAPSAPSRSERRLTGTAGRVGACARERRSPAPAHALGRRASAQGVGSPWNLLGVVPRIQNSRTVRSRSAPETPSSCTPTG